MRTFCLSSVSWVVKVTWSNRLSAAELSTCNLTDAQNGSFSKTSFRWRGSVNYKLSDQALTKVYKSSFLKKSLQFQAHFKIVQSEIFRCVITQLTKTTLRNFCFFQLSVLSQEIFLLNLSSNHQSKEISFVLESQV